MAETLSSRLIRLTVGFTPGAATDIVGRLLAKGAAPVLEQDMVVENKPGSLPEDAGRVAQQVRGLRDQSPLASCLPTCSAPTSTGIPGDRSRHCGLAPTASLKGGEGPNAGW
jgi:tripartite-type tricarboxylate transporter receptor subunit TctC